MVVAPLPQPHFAPVKGASGPLAETITIKPDAKTGNRNWPCRELSHYGTPNHRRRRSRFGEYFHCRGAEPHVSFCRHFATARLVSAPLCRIGKRIRGD